MVSKFYVDEYDDNDGDNDMHCCTHHQYVIPIRGKEGNIWDESFVGSLFATSFIVTYDRKNVTQNRKNVSESTVPNVQYAMLIPRSPTNCIFYVVIIKFLYVLIC